MSDIILSEEPQNKRKFGYLWALLAFLAIVIFITIFLLVKNKGVLNLPQRIKLGQNKLEDLEAAKIVLSWMGSQRNKDGVYNFYCECVDVGCNKCKETYDVPRLFPFTAWGRLKYFEKTKDPVDYSIMASELDKAVNDKQGLQFEFWNCKLMYDFWNSDVVKEKEKVYARVLCERQGREGTKTNLDSLESGFDFNRGVINNIIEIMTNKKVLNENFSVSNLRDDYGKFVAATSDDSVLYLWNKNKEDLSSAMKYFYFALESYKAVDDNTQNNSLLGIAALDFNKIRRDDRYMALAKFLYDENVKMGYSDVRSTNLVYFSMFANQLFEITGDVKYKQKSEEIIKEMVNNRFDYRNLGGYRNGMGCFHDKGDWCFTRENALMVGVLSKK